MKTYGRVLELNCLFLLAVALLVALQLFLQQAQQRLQLSKEEEGAEEGLVGAPEALPLEDARVDGLQDDQGPGQEDPAGLSEDSLAAAPFVPNIRKSFTKRKAPYLRKGKKNKNKKKKSLKNKNRQQTHGSQGGPKKGEGKVGNPKNLGLKGQGKFGTQKNGEKLSQNKRIRKKESGNEKSKL